MSNIKPNFENLQQQLGYQFSDLAWLKLALTHRSKSKSNYERLEFLGDSFLGFVISDVLYQQFPKQPEGILTRLRANVVRQPSLAKIARTFHLSEYLILGAGEGKSGGHNRDSTLSDVLEAIIAAIYLDGGATAARSFIERSFAQALAELDPEEQLKDAKSRLQEWLQKRGLALPEYEVIEIVGKDHNQTFKVACRIENIDKLFRGKGSSRRYAEQQAAEQALGHLMTLKQQK